MTAITVNGTEREVREGTTIGDLVGELTTATRGVAAAVNGEVVCRSQWPVRTIVGGDRVEIVSASAGG